MSVLALRLRRKSEPVTLAPDVDQATLLARINALETRLSQRDQRALKLRAALQTCLRELVEVLPSEGVPAKKKPRRPWRYGR